jgi:hypothetical protein
MRWRMHTGHSKTGLFGKSSPAPQQSDVDASQNSMAQLWVSEHYKTHTPLIAGTIGPLRRECFDASGWQIKARRRCTVTPDGNYWVGGSPSATKGCFCRVISAARDGRGMGNGALATSPKLPRPSSSLLRQKRRTTGIQVLPGFRAAATPRSRFQWQTCPIAPPAATAPRRILPVAHPVAAHYIPLAGLLSASGANSPGPYRS